MAYADDLLSAEGTRRVEAHLEKCAVCRECLASMQAYDLLVDSARSLEPPPISLTPMEERLSLEAERISMEIQKAKVLTFRRRTSFAVTLAAAAALLIWFSDLTGTQDGAMRGNTPVLEARETRIPSGEEPSQLLPQAELPPAVALAAQVTLTSGRAQFQEDAQLQEDAQRRRLNAGMTVGRNGQVFTGDDATAHVRLREGTGFAIAPGTNVALVSATSHHIRVRVHSGRTVHMVAPLEAHQTYVVEAGAYEIHVRGTHFSVALQDSGVRVELGEGHVDIVHPEGVTSLHAPAQWYEGEHEPSAFTGALLAPYGLDPTNRSVLRAEDRRITRWQLDGMEVEGSDFTLSVRTGTHRLRGWDRRGQLYLRRIEVGTEPFTVRHGEVRLRQARRDDGDLEDHQIASVIRAHRRQLQRCYERSLRQNPEIRPSLRIRITLSAEGAVESVSIQERSQSSPTLDRCVARSIRRWNFPNPGGAMAFEIPISFTPDP